MNEDLAYLVAAACILAAAYRLLAELAGCARSRQPHRQRHLLARRGAVPRRHRRLRRLSPRPRRRRAAHAAAHLYLRLHQRRLRARAGLHRAGRPASRRSGSRAPPRERRDWHRPAHPFELLRRLAWPRATRRAGGGGRVRVLALTDHDTVAGLEEAQRGASVLGLRLVPGVEISASWRDAVDSCAGAVDRSRLRSACDARSRRRPSGAARACAKCAPRLGNWACRALSCSPRSRPIPACPRARTWRQPWWPAATCGAFKTPFANTWVAASPRTSRPNGPRSRRSWAGYATRAASRASRIRRAIPCLGGRRRRLPADFAAAGGAALEVVSRRQRRAARRGLRGARAGIRAAWARWARIFTIRNSLGILWAGWLSYRPASTRCGATVTVDR